jgi:hypothetical protein
VKEKAFKKKKLSWLNSLENAIWPNGLYFF